MRFGFEKYCCFIPHRLDTFFVSIWFVMVMSFLFVSAMVLGLATPTQIPKMLLNLVPYSMIFACVALLCGYISSLFGSRKFTKLFSIMLWVGCIASGVVYIMTLCTLFFNSAALVRIILNAAEQFLKSLEMQKEKQFLLEKEKDPNLVKLENGYYQTKMDHEDGTTTTITKGEFFDGPINSETLEPMIHQYVTYFFIIYAVIAFAFQLYQLYFTSIVHTYSKKMLYYAQYHKLYAQKQEMLDKQEEKID